MDQRSAGGRVRWPLLVLLCRYRTVGSIDWWITPQPLNTLASDRQEEAYGILWTNEEPRGDTIRSERKRESAIAAAIELRAALLIVMHTTAATAATSELADFRQKVASLMSSTNKVAGG